MGMRTTRPRKLRPILWAQHSGGSHRQSDAFQFIKRGVRTDAPSNDWVSMKEGSPAAESDLSVRRVMMLWVRTRSEVQGHETLYKGEVQVDLCELRGR